jgi:ribonuclease E
VQAAESDGSVAQSFVPAQLDLVAPAPAWTSGPAAAEHAVAAPLAAPVAAPLSAPPSAPLPVAAVAVRVPEFVLPASELEALATSAGLQWVGSDAEKVRTVQEAMAREPAPVHVPREPKPPVALDEGPLVLVETRKDLSQITLPFDPQGAGSQATP